MNLGSRKYSYGGYGDVRPKCFKIKQRRKFGKKNYWNKDDKHEELHRKCQLTNQVRMMYLVTMILWTIFCVYALYLALKCNKKGEGRIISVLAALFAPILYVPYQTAIGCNKNSPIEPEK